MSRPHWHMLWDEGGSGTIIEYTIVLPIVMAIIMILMFTGYLIYDKATMEAATERTALYVTKIVADPNYEAFSTRDSTSNEVSSFAVDGSKLKTNPYRYLFGSTANVGDAKTVARNMILENQLMRNEDVQVDVKTSGTIFRKVTVSATERFRMPNFLSTLDMPPLVTIETQCTMYVNDPAELIRNADYAIDVLEDIDEALGISDKLSQIKSKITFFKDNTK